MVVSGEFRLSEHKPSLFIAQRISILWFCTIENRSTAEIYDQGDSKERLLLVPNITSIYTASLTYFTTNITCLALNNNQPGGRNHFKADDVVQMMT